MVPAELFAKVEAPNAEVEQQARDRQLTLTKPAGSLGRLEDLGVWISACQGQCPPHSIDNPRIVVFAGDHGVAQHGVSAYPSEVSLQMAANIQAGGAAINVLGRAAGASVRVVDVSLDHDVWGDERVSRSCGSIDREDAMDDDQVIRSLQIGQRVADQEVDSGVDLLIAGDLGIGNTTPAAALIGAMTSTEPVVVVGRGTGIDDEAGNARSPPSAMPCTACVPSNTTPSPSSKPSPPPTSRLWRVSWHKPPCAAPPYFSTAWWSPPPPSWPINSPPARANGGLRDTKAQNQLTSWR